VREDPERRGLLYAGTEYGVWVSMDDGTRWEPLQLNLPRVSVRDLRIQGQDLVAATHGRAFWVIDDLSPLRQLADSVTRKARHLFQPAPALLWSGGRSRGAVGENPPGGVFVDYWLKDSTSRDLRIEFLDAGGTVLQTFSSEKAPSDSAKATANTLLPMDSIAYYPSDSLVRTRAGTNRFVWNLRLPDAKELPNTVIDEGHLRGPLVPPGQYSVRLIAGRDTIARQFNVLRDPRVTTSVDDLRAQHEIAQRAVARINEIVDNVARVEDLQKQIDARVTQTKDQAFAARVAESAKTARARLEQVRAELYEVGCHVDQCTLDMPVKLYNWFITLNAQVQQGAYGPTKQHGEVYTDLKGKLDVQLRLLDQIESTDISQLNKLLQELGVPGIYLPSRKPIS
jgi:hypothetical protein